MICFTVGLVPKVDTGFCQGSLTTLIYSIIYRSNGVIELINSSQMLAKAGNPDVLGQATTEKEIYMLKGQDQTTTTAVATHEFGHMLGIWSHSFDSNDLMYPYLNSTSLSNRDKRTLVDFLYELSPDFDLHDVAGPLVHSSTGVSIPHYVSSLTTNGCQIHTSTG